MGPALRQGTAQALRTVTWELAKAPEISPGIRTVDTDVKQMFRPISVSEAVKIATYLSLYHKLMGFKKVEAGDIDLLATV